jgi:hypothetical protein
VCVMYDRNLTYIAHIFGVLLNCGSFVQLLGVPLMATYPLSHSLPSNIAEDTEESILCL